MDKLKLELPTAQVEATAGILAGHELARVEHDLSGTIHEKEGFYPYRIKPDGAIEILEHLRLAPRQRTGSTALYDINSFVTYVNRFKNGRTLVFADEFSPTPTFTALLDYHHAGAEGPAIRDLTFRAAIALRPTPNWTRWTGQSHKPMAQAVFAQFLEDNIPDIADPSGAMLVEIARQVEGSVGVEFQSGIRAQDGSRQIKYIETVKTTGSTQDGAIVIPPEITLVLTPFEGSRAYSLTARWRYRIQDKALLMWFELVRPEDVLRQAFNDEREKVAKGLENVILLNGPAPAIR